MSSSRSEDLIPVEVGQVRKGGLGVMWGVVKPHPRRKGFWLCATQAFPYDAGILGRRELEAMPLMPEDYFKEGHPGISYWQSFDRMTGGSR